MTILGIHITNEEWLQLPLRLRQRWWDETDFGRVEPSEDLKEAIRKELEKDKKNG